jgi:hypothetical protein
MGILSIGKSSRETGLIVQRKRARADEAGKATNGKRGLE